MADVPARLNQPQVASATVPELRGRILAVDYGRKRIGLAISDETGSIARPLSTLVRSNRRNDLRRLKDICRKNEVRLIVVGWPIHIAGADSEMAQEAARFAARLEKELRIKPELLDERLTSWEAGRIASESKAGRKQKALDSLAAAVLLRDYLSLKRGGAPVPAPEE